MEIKQSSEIVKDAINDAIQKENEIKAKEEALREQEVKNKEKFNKEFVCSIINELKEKIKNNSTRPEVWYVEHPFNYIDRQMKLICEGEKIYNRFDNGCRRYLFFEGQIYDWRNSHDLGRIIEDKKTKVHNYNKYFDEKVVIKLLTNADYKCDIIKKNIKRFLICPITETYYRISPLMK